MSTNDKKINPKDGYMMSPNTFSLEHYNELAAQSGAQIFTIGQSSEQRPIFVLKKGESGKRVLFIARIHGNEPAPTQAVLDFFRNYSDGEIEIYGIFLANPDGAARYEQNWLKHPEPSWEHNFEKARFNANGVDLNRDWLHLSQPETQAIQKFILTIHPLLVLDLHEFYWKDGYPPKVPTDDADGFMATMTDCPFLGVNEKVSSVCQTVMDEITPRLTKEFGWKIKLRHFIGKALDTFQEPSYLGIYLALRGIPKILVETWGVGCSTLLLKERVEFHTKAMQFGIESVVSHLARFEALNQLNSTVDLVFSIPEKDKAQKFVALLQKHSIHFSIRKETIYVEVQETQTGFVLAIFYGIK